MIERLFPEDFPFGEPEYSQMAVQIQQLKDSIAGHLDESGQRNLEELENAYLHQSNFAVRSAFEEGFRSAIELMEEVRRKPVMAPAAPQGESLP